MCKLSCCQRQSLQLVVGDVEDGKGAELADRRGEQGDVVVGEVQRGKRRECADLWGDGVVPRQLVVLHVEC